MTDPGDAEQLEVPPFREINTARLHLRTSRPTDATGLFPILCRGDVMQWTSIAPLTTLEQAERWLKDRCLGKNVYQFIIDGKDVAHVPRSLLLDWAVLIDDIEHAGQGYASEALRGLLPVLFQAIPPASAGGLDYLEGLTDRENAASRRVLEKCGFVLCETRYQDFHQPVLGLRDTCVYRIPRPGYSLEELGLLWSIGKDEESKIAAPVA